MLHVLNACQGEKIECKKRYERRLRGQRPCDEEGDVVFEEELFASSTEGRDDLLKGAINGECHLCRFVSKKLTNCSRSSIPRLSDNDPLTSGQKRLPGYDNKEGQTISVRLLRSESGV